MQLVIFYLYLMFYTYVIRFDVARNLKNFANFFKVSKALTGRRRAVIGPVVTQVSAQAAQFLLLYLSHLETSQFNWGSQAAQSISLRGPGPGPLRATYARCCPAGHRHRPQPERNPVSPSLAVRQHHHHRGGASVTVLSCSFPLRRRLN